MKQDMSAFAESANRIKELRKNLGVTQAELARQLGISRAAVNAWEMGIAMPATQYVVALAELFHVSSDYILGMNARGTMDVSDLRDSDIAMLHSIAEYLRER